MWTWRLLAAASAALLVLADGLSDATALGNRDGKKNKSLAESEEIKMLKKLGELDRQQKGSIFALSLDPFSTQAFPSRSRQRGRGAGRRPQVIF